MERFLHAEPANPMSKVEHVRVDSLWAGPVGANAVWPKGWPNVTVAMGVAVDTGLTAEDRQLHGIQI